MAKDIAYEFNNRQFYGLKLIEKKGNWKERYSYCRRE